MKNHLNRISKEIKNRYGYYYAYYHWDASDYTTIVNEQGSFKCYTTRSKERERDYIIVFYKNRYEAMNKVSEYLGNVFSYRNEMAIIGYVDEETYTVEYFKETKTWSPNMNSRNVGYESRN